MSNSTPKEEADVVPPDIYTAKTLQKGAFLIKKNLAGNVVCGQEIGSQHTSWFLVISQWRY